MPEIIHDPGRHSDGCGCGANVDEKKASKGAGDKIGIAFLKVRVFFNQGIKQGF